MAYDEKLAQRLDALIKERKDIYSQKMFGGLGFLLKGNMCFGIWKDSLILRLGINQSETALKQKNVNPFDITGRAMKGWVLVKPEAFKTKSSLEKWVKAAIVFVETLPGK